MEDLGRLIAVFAREESGATAVEYGLIAALMAVAAIAAMVSFGGGLSGLFNHVADTSAVAMSGG